MKKLLFFLAFFLLAGCATKNAQSANSSEFAQICETGDAKACFLAGDEIYFRGKAGTKSQAFGYFQKACSGGIMPACGVLGRLYLLGDGCEKDAKSALLNYEKACNAGISDACAGAGIVYFDEDIGLRDDKMALSYFQKACQMDSSVGCGMAGGMYSAGFGAKANRQKALNFYQKSCKLGDKGGCKSYEKLKSGKF